MVNPRPVTLWAYPVPPSCSQVTQRFKGRCLTWAIVRVYREVREYKSLEHLTFAVAGGNTVTFTQHLEFQLPYVIALTRTLGGEGGEYQALACFFSVVERRRSLRLIL